MSETAAKASTYAANQFRTDAADQDQTLAAVLRRRMPTQSWSAVRRLCETGKVRIEGQVILNPAHRIALPCDVTLNMTAPRRREEVPGFRVAFEDAHLIVIEKPHGISSVPFERKETGTALDLIRDHWRSQRIAATTKPLYTVHRIDKETSGLLCFAKTKACERGLHEIFQRHLSARSYLALAHGQVRGGRIESQIVPDRGDGLRGSTRNALLGQRAVTNVDVLARFHEATFCRVRLETGRTHQIRIHLSEAGHPLVGEAVYIRDWENANQVALPASRMMLHAETLGFDHPITGSRIDLDSPAPDAFASAMARLTPIEGVRGA